MRNCYHGRTFGTVAITGNRSWKASSNDPFGTHYLHGADRLRCPLTATSSDADYIDACVEDLRELLATAINPGDVGALIAEPIQGVGGFTMAPRRAVHAPTRRSSTSTASCSSPTRCRPAGAAPASTSGAIQAHGVTPDLMTFAKGLGNGFAIGGVVGRGDLLDGIRGNGISTFGGNPISTAAGNATLDYVLDHDLQSERRRPAARSSSTGSGPPASDLKTVADVRGKGLMLAVELADPGTGKPSPALRRQGDGGDQERGLLVGKGGLYGNDPADGAAADAHRGRGARGPRPPGRRAGGRGRAGGRLT